MAEKLVFPNKKLQITETVLRDAHQSLAATRMSTADMLGACKELDEVGYWSLECWGGATFDACMRFLGEDPWGRLRMLRRAMPNTRLQMLLRGQNLVGYRNYADDVVRSFCKKSIENGIDVVRIFDALNDVRNMKTAMDSVKAAGGICEAAICYTVSPVQDEDYFVELAQTLCDMGADIIAIKDMANLLLPVKAFSLVSKIKKKVNIPIHLHTHNTAGTGDSVYLMAALAGVDIIDTALSPFAGGTSQPATETMIATMKSTSRDTGISLEKLEVAVKHFKTVANKMQKSGILNPKMLAVDPNALIYQVPGGMISNLYLQLCQAGHEESFDQVLKEVPKVRADFGYPPLVTPTSQIVGTQATMNVLGGKRYKTFTSESKALLRGEYGALPSSVNPDVAKKALGKDRVITCRPADLLCDELEEGRKKFSDIARSEEDLLSCILFPKIATDFLKKKNESERVHEIEVVWDENSSLNLVDKVLS